MRTKLLCITALIALCFPIGSGKAQMIADIRQDVQTEFGTYHPYLVEVTPAVEPYTIAPDFSNVINFKDFVFNTSEESLLARNGFVVTPGRNGEHTGYLEIFDIYNECREYNIPIFVTTDAMLHTFHMLYDYILRTIEEQKFYNDLTGLNAAMLAKVKQYYDIATDPNVKEAARRDVAFFTVASRLMDSSVTVPAYVDSLVNAELTLIKNHEDFAFSPIFERCGCCENKEDYSQYKPRGHYTLSDSLRRYFKAMMWYGRMTFLMEPEKCLDLTQRHTLQALLLLQALANITVDGEPGLIVWQQIYLPTVFFVGKTDDLNIHHYSPLALKVYGKDFTSLPVDSLGNSAGLSQFIVLADQLPGPKIRTWTLKGFRFMGQRFIPDSYMFSRLVHPIVVGRDLPKGLDVMTILGSDRAFEILDQVYHETSYPNYTMMLDSLRTQFGSLPDSLWAQNLYWNWLYCLMPFLFPKGEGYPIFMQNQAWQDKELATALGSWAELRHDTILYAKQSYTLGGKFLLLQQGYVEPNPYFYARLAALVNLMIVGLDRQGLLLEKFASKLSDFSTLLLSLKRISEKELTNQPLSKDEYELICNIGLTIEDIVTFSTRLGNYGPQGDAQMPVIADVHTGLHNTCLEEGIGYPLNIYVIVNIEGQLIVARGAVFSYYEFEQPISDRLDDEQWRSMLKSQSPPLLAIWMGSYVDLSGDFLNNNPGYYYWGRGGINSLSLSAVPDTAAVGDSVTIIVEVSGWVASDLDSIPLVQIQPISDMPINLEVTLVDSNGGYKRYIGALNTTGWQPGVIYITAQASIWSNRYELNYRTHFVLTKKTGILPHQLGSSIFSLSQNYPNPFNSETIIRYQLPVPAKVSLKIFNLLGQEARTLVDMDQGPGYYAVRWDGKDKEGKDIPTGLYFCRMEASSGNHKGFIQMKKILIVR